MKQELTLLTGDDSINTLSPPSCWHFPKSLSSCGFILHQSLAEAQPHSVKGAHLNRIAKWATLDLISNVTDRWDTLGLQFLIETHENAHSVVKTHAVVQMDLVPDKPVTLIWGIKILNRDDVPESLQSLSSQGPDSKDIKWQHLYKPMSKKNCFQKGILLMKRKTNMAFYSFRHIRS